jgi:5-(carboxyamino)imidazole ribonucleotide synthase
MKQEQEQQTRRVGVIGGGQLAWMMSGAANRLGLELWVQTPSDHDPAASVASGLVLGAIDDAIATQKLAETCDVLTFENEFIDLDALMMLANQGTQFRPSLQALNPLLDKYHQRSYLRDLGLPTPHFINIESANPDWSVLAELGEFPVVLKTRRHGYDGQGTVIVEHLEQVQQVWERWGRSPLIAEEFVPFERELAVIAARSLDGDVKLFPVVETQQEQQVCKRVLVTGDWPVSVQQQVEAIAHKLLTQLDFVGIMGIEFFLTKMGKVLVNETAPRTHNSGHYTLDACPVSQFEQQLRAVTGLPLGDPAMSTAGAVMVNLLGYEQATSDYLETRQQLAQLPHTQVYWYGKAQSRPGRKLGHVTTLIPAWQPKTGDRHTQAMELARSIEAIWYPGES